MTQMALTTITAQTAARGRRARMLMGVLSFIGTITVFGTPIDVILSELALESFFPADAATAAALRQMPS